MKELNLSELRYVLFDWDNTLAASRTVLVTTINEILKKYGLPSWDISSQKRDKDLSFRDNFPNIFGPQNAAAAYEEYADLYIKMVPQLISSFPMVKETLSLFQSCNIPIIVMSNKDRRLLDFELPLLYNPNIFTRVVAGHEAPRDKPYPEHVFYSLRNFLTPEEISPQKVWVVGDSYQDSTCALAANAQAIRIGTPIWKDSAKKDAEVIYFDDFTQFYNTLKNNMKLVKI